MGSILAEHLGYVSDPVRLELFQKAIQSVVRPGCSVADLGCGTGVLGLFALRAGAERVYCIDDSGMIEVARETIARCGLAGRARFIRGLSARVQLPEPVDVAVCDHVGWLGFDYGVVGLLQDARRRLLKPGGALVPRSIRLQVAAIESQRCRALAGEWTSDRVPPEFHWVHSLSVNRLHPATLAPEELLSAPGDLGTLDLREEQPQFLSWSARLEAQRGGSVHGLAGWFDCELAPGIRMTNSPLSPGRIDRAQAFLAIDESVEVERGDRIDVTVMARPADELVGWNVTFARSGRRFSHSTWQGRLLSPDDLVRSDPARVPQPNSEGLARGIVMAYCDGRRTIRDIEQAVLRDHGSLFPSSEEISRFVIHVLARDTK